MTASTVVVPVEWLDVRLCGGLRVSCADRDLVLTKTARQGRVALAYLVLNHDRAVTREELMERLWTDPDPQRVGASLSQTLSRLRQVLGRERLIRLPGGAVQLCGPLRTDIAHAHERLDEGRLAAAEADWSHAFEASGAVLGELAGEVLAGDEGEWLEDVRRAVADVRLEALELRATAALRLGACGKAVAAARSAVAASPMRQSAWALLIEAQAAHGDEAQATQTFHQFRRLLSDESGLTPDPELIELHRRLVGGELNREPPAPAGRPLAFPAALALATHEAAFVGREHLLRRLHERYARACDGARQFVLLCGEPGIGKTRLAGEFARRVHGDGAIVLYGRSDAETLVPYQPFVTAIGHYVDERGNADLARELGPELSELSRLIPGLRRRMPELREPLGVEPEMRRYRLFNAVAHVLGFIARERPTALILDDLQWADPSTALLLRHTVAEMHAVKLLVLGTFVDAAGCRSDRLVDFIARPQPGYERIALRGLDAEETVALVQARQRCVPTAPAIGMLLEASGGNPLLLEETLKSLAESAPGEGVTAATVRRVGVPEGARHVIGCRLRRLTDATQRALADASVIGAEFDLRVLEAVADARPEQTIDALEEAQAAGLLREVPDAVDRFVFSHALVRDALREGQSAARRRRLHHRIGVALERIGPAGGHPAELAHHFTESRAPEDARKALEYSLQAGHRAAESLAHEDAAVHFRRALGLLAPDDERRRCEVLLALGCVELRQGSPEARRTFRDAFALAQRSALPALMGQAALGFAGRHVEAGVVDLEGIAQLRTARAGLDAGALHAQLTARLADSLHFAPEPGEAQRLSDEALATAHAVGDPHALAAALQSRHAALRSVEHLDERLRLSEELLELARGMGERELEARGHHCRIYDLLEAAREDEAARERRALDALAQELRQPLYRHFAAGWAVVWAQMTGNVAEVGPLAERFHALGREAQARDTETIHTAQMIALHRRQERLSDFVVTVRAAVDAHPTLVAWRAVLTLAHLVSGEPRAAVAEFEWLAHDRFRRVPRDMFWFPTVCVLAETCALIGDRARAQVLYELLAPFGERNVQVTQAACWGSAERFLGLLAAVLGREETAAAHLASAIAKNDAGGNAAAASLVRRDLAKLLSARGAAGDCARAVELLRAALAAARQAGTPALVARVRAEIEAVEALPR